MPSNPITITSPEFTRVWQFLRDHLLNEIAAGEPEGREALDTIEAALEHAQARTAEDERRDTLAYLRARANGLLAGAVGRPPRAMSSLNTRADMLHLAASDLGRGAHEGASKR